MKKLLKKVLRKEDGSLNWKFILIGTSWKKFLVTTLWFIAVLMMSYGYNNDKKQYMDVYENPCKYCSQVEYIDTSKMNITIIREQFLENKSFLEDETKKEGASPITS